MSAPRWAIFALAWLAIGCRARKAGSDAGADAGAPTASAPIACGVSADVEVEEFVASLQDAIGRHDRAKVASLVRYPLRVHTEHCLKQLAGPADLLAHYDEVFSLELESDIFTKRSPFFVRDSSFELASGGRVWAWAGDDGHLLVGAVFLGKIDLAGVQCADRVIEPIPVTVWGTWSVTSMRAGPMEQLTSFPWEDWKGFSVTLDRSGQTLESSFKGLHKSCKVLWLARDTTPDPPDPSRCAAFESFWGLRAHERSRLLEASCSAGDLLPAPVSGAGVNPELVLLDNGRMVVRLGCEGIAVLKRQSAKRVGPAPRRVPRGAGCGTPDVECAPGTRCVTVSASPWEERCKALDRPAE